jgi:hypothetical protein
MSSTPSEDLKMWWSNINQTDREARNVYTLDNPHCIESMMFKIFKVN